MLLQTLRKDCLAFYTIWPGITSGGTQAQFLEKSTVNTWSKVSFTFPLLLPLSPSSLTMHLSSSASLSSCPFFSLSVSYTTANDSVIWKACMVFYSEYWLSHLASLVNAPNIWKILINNILFSNPSYTQHCATLSETMTGKSIHMRRHIHTHINTHTLAHLQTILKVPLCVFLSSVAPWNYTNQIKNNHDTYTHNPPPHTHTNADTHRHFTQSLYI